MLQNTPTQERLYNDSNMYGAWISIGTGTFDCTGIILVRNVFKNWTDAFFYYYFRRKGEEAGMYFFQNWRLFSGRTGSECRHVFFHEQIRNSILVAEELSMRLSNWYFLTVELIFLEEQLRVCVWLFLVFERAAYFDHNWSIIRITYIPPFQNNIFTYGSGVMGFTCLLYWIYNVDSMIALLLPVLMGILISIGYLSLYKHTTNRF